MGDSVHSSLLYTTFIRASPLHSLKIIFFKSISERNVALPLLFMFQATCVSEWSENNGGSVSILSQE